MRLINADALKELIEKLIEHDNAEDFNKGYNIALQGVVELIDNAPTVKPCENCDLYFKAMTKKEMQKGGAE